MLASAALSVLLAAGLLTAAFAADGGAGGGAGGGVGGVGNGGNGGNGTNGSGAVGGGGGGASGTSQGGSGGNGLGAQPIVNLGIGGAGGTASSSENGSDGTQGSTNTMPGFSDGGGGGGGFGVGAGGGGGGGAGGTGAAPTITFGYATGGQGGRGGASGAAGGFGGAGGNITAQSFDSAASATATGGAGGNGGNGGIGGMYTGSATVTGVNGGMGGTGGSGGYATATAGGSGGSNSATAVATGGAGGGGGAGGAALLLSGTGATLNLNGAFQGGPGGSGGPGGNATASAYTGSGATATATAMATGGRGGDGGVGGNGLTASTGVTINNSASLMGGIGGMGGMGGGYVPSVTATASGGSGASSTATGGRGGNGGAGGIGALITGSGATFNNKSGFSVSGGAGGYGGIGGVGNDFNGAGGTGGAGGIGVSVSGSGATVRNTGGAISGGTGGDGGRQSFFGSAPIGAAGGPGGIGVNASNAMIFNNASGTISGGNGGTGLDGGTPGAGGIGIVGAHLTIDNNGGTINGGQGGGSAVSMSASFVRASAVVLAAAPALGPQAYAIQFTGGTNYVGTGGAINGGIYVMGGSFQPQLNTNPIGTQLAVNGPINFAPGTFYNVRITPNANDSAVATGGATLTGASVNVAASAGTYKINEYTILTANAGLTGKFTGVSINQDFAFLTPTLSYDATHVYLNIAPTNPIIVTNPMTGQPVTNPKTGQPVVVPNYVPVAVTYNQIAVAQGLTQAGIQNFGRSPILRAFNQLSTPQALATLNALSGEGITGAQNVAHRAGELFTSSIFDQTAFYGGGSGGGTNSITLTAPLPGFTALARPDQTLAAAGQGQPIRELADLPNRSTEPEMPALQQRTWRAWATGYGGVDDIHGNAYPVGSAEQNNTLFGGALGVDYQLTPNYLLGVAVGGSDGIFQVPGRGTSGSSTGGQVALYDIYRLGAWYGASSTAFEYYTNRSTRFVAGFGGLSSETERADFDSHEFRSRLEFGRNFNAYGAMLTPFAALEIADLRSDGFNETSISGPGLFRLNVSGQSTASVPAFAGLRVQRVTPLGNGMVLSPTLQLAYVHEFAPYRQQLGSLPSLPGATFLIDGARPARDSAQVKTGAELALNAHAALYANFEGEFSGINQFYAGKGGFRYLW